MAFENHWFGSKSQGRVEVLIANFRARYDAYPAASSVLRHWPHMDPDTRRIICFWHLQLADPMVRAFTGEYLLQRRTEAGNEVDRDRVIRWVEQQQPGRWASSTKIQWASKLLTTAYETGLVATNRDPRPLTFPKVPDPALAYALHLLRGIRFQGTLLDNPYLAAVGLIGTFLQDRLRALPGIGFRKMGDLVDFQWKHQDLASWAEAAL